MNKVILVDDDIDFAGFFSRALHHLGFECETINDSSEIFSRDLREYGHIVIDLLMPNFDGLQIIRHLKDVDYRGYISVVSGQDQSVLEAAREICQLHKLAFHSALKKPFDLDSLEELTRALPASAHFTKPASSTPTVGDGELLRALADAIDREELMVFFQPKINLRLGTVVGFEALARWQLGGQFIPPTRFIPLAERSGLIDRLTKLIFAKSLGEFASFQGLTDGPSLSINLSALELGQGQLPDLLKERVDFYGIAYDRIVLEITETVLLEKNSLSLEVLTRLRMIGFRLSIDDFGTGYSSVNMLQNGPFTELKIDRSFVSLINANEQASIIVQSVIQMARRLDLAVVAEGIEDAETLSALIDMECTVGQGYFFSKPQPADSVRAWLASREKENMDSHK